MPPLFQQGRCVVRKVKNIIDVIIKDFIDGAPLSLGVGPFEQGQAAERRRIRGLLTGMRFPAGGAQGTVPAIGLEDIGSAIVNITQQDLTKDEFDKCIEYANKMMTRLAARKIRGAKVLTVCGIILLVAGRIQQDLIAESAQESKQ